MIAKTYRYSRVKAPDHPRANRHTGFLAEHVVIASKAIGYPLPRRAQVHHVNEDPTDNRPSNLVICENQAFHRLLHMRTRALKACGNANWTKCDLCKQYGPPETMWHDPRRPAHNCHRECNAAYQLSRRRAKKTGPTAPEEVKANG